MNLPRLTAESAIGPALNCYVNTGAALSPGPGGTDGIGPMQDILSDLGCLLSCGVPNALSIAFQCGVDLGCWAEKGGSAVLGCISKCFS